MGAMIPDIQKDFHIAVKDLLLSYPKMPTDRDSS